MIIDLYSFILTGKFGEIKINSSRNEIIQFLGKPDDISIDDDIFKYGNVEFGLNGLAVVSISINLKDEEFHKCININNLEDLKLGNIKQTESILNKLKLSTIKKNTISDQTLLILDNSVFLTFEDDQLVYIAVMATKKPFLANL